MDRAPNIKEDPAWLEAFGKMTGIEDKTELQRLHSLAKLFQSSRTTRPRSSERPKIAASQSMTQAPGPAAIMDIHDAYEAQKDHMSMIACSLGACPECWGHDPDCTECVGEGRPGAFLPDERCFERFVLPVVQRILRDSKSPALDKWGTPRTERQSAKHRS